MNTTIRDSWGDLTFGSDDQQSCEKLRELILYIADKCEDDPDCGAVKLNKILFYADFGSFVEYGVPITGVKYRKLPQGPVLTILKRIRSEMQERGEIVVRKKRYYNRIQHRVVPLRDPDFSKLGARDIAIVDEVIEHFSGRNATEVSKMSHGLAWQVAADNEPIPYDAAFIYNRELTEQEIMRAHDLAAKYGWED